MICRRAVQAVPVVAFLLIAGPTWADPDAAAPDAGSGTGVARADTLQLFGGRAARPSDPDDTSVTVTPVNAGGSLPGGPASASAGTGVPAARPVEGSRGDEAALEIKRPGLGEAGSGVGNRDLESRRILRDGEEKTRSSLKDFVPLLAVLGLIGVAALVVKRFLPARRLLTGSGVLEIVARTPLSSKQSLVLVKMGRRLVLVGVTAEQINALCQVEEPDQVAVLLGEVASEQPESMRQAFAHAFDDEAGAYSREPAERDAAAQAGHHVRGLLEKVRKLKRRREVA